MALDVRYSQIRGTAKYERLGRNDVRDEEVSHQVRSRSSGTELRDVGPCVSKGLVE